MAEMGPTTVMERFLTIRQHVPPRRCDGWASARHLKTLLRTRTRGLAPRRQIGAHRSLEGSVAGHRRVGRLRMKVAAFSVGGERRVGIVDLERSTVAAFD